MAQITKEQLDDLCVIDPRDNANRDVFTEYCWSFYGPGGIYGGFFDNNLTYGELNAAVDLQMTVPDFEGDTVDREKVRERLFEARRREPV